VNAESSSKKSTTARRGNFFCHVSMTENQSCSVTSEEQRKKSKSRPARAAEETTASQLTVRKNDVAEELDLNNYSALEEIVSYVRWDD
jgi:hypothetical protein